MDRVANLSDRERRELFDATADKQGMNPAVIEKDFCVSWILKRLFSDPELKSRLIFKGETSLSKVYNLIERFSEDIDLVLDWQLLGYGEGRDDPYRDFQSNTKRDRFNKEVNRKAAEYIAGALLSDIDGAFSGCPEIRAAVDTGDPHSVNVRYPSAIPDDYLRPELRLEIGPLASWTPSSEHRIRPYAAEAFPEVFDSPETTVVVIDAERTFWEKAAILHQEAHRTSVTPSRYARHYYDLYKLANGRVLDRTIRDADLCQSVVEFKQRFYPCTWARYDDAKPGSFRLIPERARIRTLERDYCEMRLMIFGAIPSFDDILKTLGELETRING